MIFDVSNPGELNAKNYFKMSNIEFNAFAKHRMEGVCRFHSLSSAPVLRLGVLHRL
jgi:hypothetical protein